MVTNPNGRRMIVPGSTLTFSGLAVTTARLYRAIAPGLAPVSFSCSSAVGM